MVSKLKSERLLSVWCDYKCSQLLDIANEIEKLESPSKPNYGKLRNMLQALIHEEKKREFQIQFDNTFK